MICAHNRLCLFQINEIFGCVNYYKIRRKRNNESFRVLIAENTPCFIGHEEINLVFNVETKVLLYPITD